MRNELEATSLHAITHPEDLERDQRSFHDLLRGEIPSYQVEKRYRHVWGHYLWVLVTVALVRDQRGEPLYLCWVVGRALELIAEHARAGRRLVLHVNLSGKSIGDPRVAVLVEKAVSDSGVDPACLIFELTETTVITRFDEAKTFACRLSALGCRFALDEFAAGFGTLHYLECLPFDYFKIDGDLIRGIVTSPTEQLVIGAIVGIARGMGKKTIAEFVADADTCRLLAKGGVDYVQGHYVGQPRPLSTGLPAV